MSTEWVGEAHTDLPYTDKLAIRMFHHAVESAHGKMIGLDSVVKPGEGRTFYLVMQCLYTPGESGVPNTYDVTATLNEVTATYTIPRESPKRRWWRKGCTR